MEDISRQLKATQGQHKAEKVKRDHSSGLRVEKSAVEAEEAIEQRFETLQAEFRAFTSKTQKKLQESDRKTQKVLQEILSVIQCRCV